RQEDADGRQDEPELRRGAVGERAQGGAEAVAGAAEDDERDVDHERADRQAQEGQERRKEEVDEARTEVAVAHAEQQGEAAAGGHEEGEEGPPEEHDPRARHAEQHVVEEGGAERGGQGEGAEEPRGLEQAPADRLSQSVESGDARPGRPGERRVIRRRGRVHRGLVCLIERCLPPRAFVHHTPCSTRSLTFASNARVSTGLATMSSAPASMDTRWALSMAVTAMMGMVRVSSRRRNSRMAWSPSNSGIMMSMRIRSGCSATACSTASRPLLASSAR